MKIDENVFFNFIQMPTDKTHAERIELTNKTDTFSNKCPTTVSAFFGPKIVQCIRTTSKPIASDQMDVTFYT